MYMNLRGQTKRGAFLPLPLWYLEFCITVLFLLAFSSDILLMSFCVETLFPFRCVEYLGHDK